MTLAQTVPVDYFIPGCPPEERTTWLALEALINGKMPPKGTVISHSAKSVCNDCPRQRNVKKVKKFYRTYEIKPEKGLCLLEQGILCAGIATHGGAVPRVRKPTCRAPAVMESSMGSVDQGAHFLSGVASVIDSNDPAEVKKILEDIRDPAGTFYRYSLADSLLRRAKVK